MPDLDDLLICRADISEQKQLEDLRLRHPLPMPVVVTPCSPTLTPSNCRSRRSPRLVYLPGNGRERLSDLPRSNPEQMEKANLMHCLSTPTCDVAGSHDR
jgi:hypothetical protein